MAGYCILNYTRTKGVFNEGQSPTEIDFTLMLLIHFR